MKLTQTVVDKLRSSKADEIFLDDDLPGFGIRLRAGGSRKYCVSLSSSRQAIPTHIDRSPRWRSRRPAYRIVKGTLPGQRFIITVGRTGALAYPVARPSVFAYGKLCVRRSTALANSKIRR